MTLDLWGYGVPGPGERTASLHEPDLYLHPSEIRQYANPENGFKRFTFPEFKRQVAQDGAIREPVWINTDGEHAYLSDGHHRTQAADELGFDRVPVYVTRDNVEPEIDPPVGDGLRTWLNGGGQIREPGWDLEDDDHHHTAHRTAMPQGGWYHASPYELPVGTVLTPGGGPTQYDRFYDRTDQDRAGHVWVDTLRNVKRRWADPDHFVYQVEPHAEPQPFQRQVGQMLVSGEDGHTTPGATITKVVRRPHTAHRTAMPYYHNTDAELNPGDMLLPAAERGHKSRWQDEEYGTVPTYDPHSVYMYNEHGNPEHYQDFGQNRYEVEPAGDIRRDPEWEDLRKDFPTDEDVFEEFGMNPEDVPGAHSYVAPRARVIRKINPKKARTMTAAVTVYTKPSCPQCDMTKKLLDRLGVEHDTVDVTADPEAHAYVTGLGYQQAPVVVVGDGEAHWGGFKVDRLKGLAQ